MTTKDKQHGGSQVVGLYDKLAPGPGRLPSDVARHQITRIHRAMIDITSKRGYESIRARDVVRLAGISTRSFYEHFASKEDCFVHTYELLVRRAGRRIIAAQEGERDWRSRLQRMLGAFLEELEGDPGAARLVLIEAPAAGPAAREQVRRAERAFEWMVAESLARQPGGIEVPALVVEGMVAGIAHVARTRLHLGREKKMSCLAGELTGWLLCFPHGDAEVLSVLDAGSVKRSGRQWEGQSMPGFRSEESNGDRALVLAAVVKLLSTDASVDLTVPRIRSAAGISRQRFDSHFDGVDDCVLAAVDQHAGEALSRSAAAQAAGRSWPGGIYRAICTLCEQVQDNRFLANACVTRGFLLGPGTSRLGQRFAASFVEQFQHSAPEAQRPSDLVAEASANAVWALFKRQVAREPMLKRPQVAATLAYMVLAPAIGPSGAVVAIRDEQNAPLGI